MPAVVVRIPSVFGDQRRFQINAADAVWSWSQAMIDTGSATRRASRWKATSSSRPCRPTPPPGRSCWPTRATPRPGTRYVDAVPAAIGGTQDLVEAIRAAGHRLRPCPDREWYSRVGELDPGRVWVAGIAGQVAAQLAADPSAAAPRTLRRFAVPDDGGELGELLRTRALHTPAHLAGYIRTLDAS